jgi:transposase
MKACETVHSGSGRARRFPFRASIRCIPCSRPQTKRGRLGNISNCGDPCLRTLLIQRVCAVRFTANEKHTGAEALLRQRPAHVAELAAVSRRY